MILSKNICPITDCFIIVSLNMIRNLEHAQVNMECTNGYLGYNLNTESTNTLNLQIIGCKDQLKIWSDTFCHGKLKLHLIA